VVVKVYEFHDGNPPMVGQRGHNFKHINQKNSGIFLLTDFRAASILRLDGAFTFRAALPARPGDKSNRCGWQS